jgi:hypothetical protein
MSKYNSKGDGQTEKIQNFLERYLINRDSKTDHCRYTFLDQCRYFFNGIASNHMLKIET